MNTMIVAVGMEPGRAAFGGTAEGAAFAAAFAAMGLILILAGGFLLKSFHQPHAVRY